MKLIFPYRTGNVRVTSPYGMRTLDGETAMHKGVDLVGADKTLIAPCDGKIAWAGMVSDRNRGGRTWEWGNYVRLETDDGYKIYLCHMAAVTVNIGQTVKTGDVLGMEGSTGKSMGSHCHLEIRTGGISMDPTPFLGIPNREGSYPAAGTDFAELVCQKAGLEEQTKEYLNRYRFASDLWRKLWNAMGEKKGDTYGKQ